MKRIKLTQGKYALVDDEDYKFLNQWKWQCAKDKSGILYAVRGVTKFYRAKQTMLKMHRVILGLIDSRVLCDHIDHDGLNNQKSNLRIATRSENARNRRSMKNSSSKYLGVTWVKREYKWMAAIHKADSVFYLGKFENETDAAIAYNKKALELHGEFANLNIIK